MFIPKISRWPRDTPLTRLLRLLALLSVFVLVGVLYWHYFEHSLDQIQTKQAIWDQTNILTEDQKKTIHSFTRMLNSRYGIDLQLKVTRESITNPTHGPRTLFIGICPDRQEVTVIFPPLVRSALGTEFQEYLAKEHFTPFWQDERWPQGLGSALTRIGERLEQLENNDTTS